MAPPHSNHRRGRRGGSRRPGQPGAPLAPSRPPAPVDPGRKAATETARRPDRAAIQRTASAATAPPRTGGEWIYGRHPVAAALDNPLRRIRQVIALAEAAASAAELMASARARLPAEPQPRILPRESFEALLPGGAVHQGIALAAAPLPDLAIDDVIERAGPAPGDAEAPQIVVLLDQVSDPHNIGAVLRSAAAFGAMALIIPEHGAPPVTGVLAKAASGAIEHVPIVRVVNLARTMDRLKSAGFWCLGLDEAAERALPDLSLGRRLALVLGAEGDGMRRLTRERCDLIARLPTLGAMASLNVSNAAAIALYELTRAAAAATPKPAAG